MIYSSVTYQEWSSSVTGKTLIGVNGLIYILDKPEFDHPQQLQLVFSDSSDFISFKCGKDGASLELTEIPLLEKDLGEYGKEVIMDISHLSFFGNLLGKSLSKVCSIFSTVENAYIGIRLAFENKSSLIVVNIGDEINYFDVLDSSYEKDEGIEYQDL